MGLTLLELSRISGAELRGDPARVISHAATLQQAGEGAISFLANRRYAAYLADTKASAVILGADDAADCPTDCLVSDNPYLAHARVMSALYPDKAPVPGIHPSAQLDPTAQVAESAQVAANCYLGPGVVVEADAYIGPGSVLLDDVTIGGG